MPGTRDFPRPLPLGKDIANDFAKIRPKHRRGAGHSDMDVDSSNILALEESPARLNGVVTAREALDRFGPPAAISGITSRGAAK